MSTCATICNMYCVSLQKVKCYSEAINISNKISKVLCRLSETPSLKQEVSIPEKPLEGSSVLVFLITGIIWCMCMLTKDCRFGANSKKLLLWSIPYLETKNK